MRVADLLGAADVFIRAATWAQRNARENLGRLGDPARDNEFKRDFPDMEWDYAAIERVDSKTQSLSILTFNLGKALQNDPGNNLLLKAGDTVVVFSKADFRQPESKKFRVVRIEGEVRFPGVYPIEMGETLHQIFARAGGLTDQAYIYGTIFSRMSARKLEEQRLRQASDRVEQDYLRYLAGRSRNAVSTEEAGVSSTEFEAVRSLVSRLRAFQPEGRIPLNLRGLDAIADNFPKIPLEDDDRIVVPSRPATVTVVGAVFQEGSLLWMPDWSTRAYIDSAGGFRRHADTSGVVVMHADGTVRQSGGWLGRNENIYPGDTVVVPENVELTSWTRIFRDWAQIFYQLGLGAAAIKILGFSL
jgi:protein involved in polysaccharide export with SLBB domain